ncbi:MAG: hypothetical protein AAGH79_08495 [Bacteroidota bacterium]
MDIVDFRKAKPVVDEIDALAKITDIIRPLNQSNKIDNPSVTAAGLVAKLLKCDEDLVGEILLKMIAAGDEFCKERHSELLDILNRI